MKLRDPMYEVVVERGDDARRHGPALGDFPVRCARDVPGPDRAHPLRRRRRRLGGTGAGAGRARLHRGPPGHPRSSRVGGDVRQLLPGRAAPRGRGRIRLGPVGCGPARSQRARRHLWDLLRRMDDVASRLEPPAGAARNLVRRRGQRAAGLPPQWHLASRLHPHASQRRAVRPAPPPRRGGRADQ